MNINKPLKKFIKFHNIFCYEILDFITFFVMKNNKKNTLQIMQSNLSKLQSNLSKKCRVIIVY